MEFLLDFDNGQRKYERAIDVSSLQTLRIGVDNTNQIIINSPYVRSDSIQLSRSNSGFVMKVFSTTFGVYHNGTKVEGACDIKNKDFFSISDFIFYYDNEILWTEIRDGMYFNDVLSVEHPTRNNYPKFNRNTRIKSVINTDAIEVLDPPSKPQKTKSNILTRLLPSISMLVVAAVTASMGGAMVIMSAVSGSMAIVTSIISLRDSNKEFKKKSAERIEKYNNYIANKKNEIELIRNNEQAILNKIYLSQDEEKKMLYEFSPSLFERSVSDDDFLCVKLGNGSVEAKRTVKFKKQERLEVEDELQLLPQKVSDDYKCIVNAPVVCDLKTINAVGVVGSEVYRFNMMKNIVIDVAARQYFSDVKMVFIAEENNADKIFWLRLLPHVYNEEIGIRTLVTDDESKNLIFEYLYKELTYREQSKKYTERIIVFFYDEYGFKNHPICKFVDKAKDLGVTFIFFGEKVDDIPMGCGYIAAENGENASLIYSDDFAKSIDFSYPVLTDEEATKIVELLAPIYSEEISLEGTLTKNISMFEMLNIIAVDDLNLEDRWNKSLVFKSMAAPIGVSKSGLVYLDLHDKAHGPHGLVAGTTGSGKSEILQTYILSIATLFHPYEIGFVIIDFKGGGMVNQFKDLPHLMGAITNIDGKEIDRSLKSIKAELQKRQRLFADAEVNHIDKYIKRFKAGEVEVPLPHLILVVDEFAELKAEQPEFMKELISAARIGRSLGVHLILATQKPSGQVNEQIWSNSKFKLCLKVQSQEDSNEVIKSPLAAEIKEPGRAYLQVGNNEIFELFQSAYSGAPEKLDDALIKEFNLYSLNSCGKKTPVYVQKKKKAEGNISTQLDSIVQYVADYSISKGIKRLPNICLPSLKDYITIPTELGDYNFETIPFGVYDDPDSQYQGVAHFNLSDDNLMIIGSSQTGKTNLLQSVIRLISSRYSPKEAVFYIADFGAMYLKNFEPLNHVGGVVTISEGEKFKNLFKLLTEEIQKRKNKFLDCGLSSYTAYSDAGYSDMPRIFFIIDNFSAFKEVYADAFEDQFVYLTREGIACGLSIIITNATTSGLGYRYMSNFACRVAFKCNESSEYMSIFDRCRMEPKDVPGRMLCKLNKELYEMQTYIAFEGEKEIERSNAIRAFVEEINSQNSGVFAKKIPSIPEHLTFNYIDDNYNYQSKTHQYPVGLDYANVDVVAIDFKAWNEFCIIGKDMDKKLTATKSLLSSIHHNILSKPVRLYIVDGVERNLKDKSNLGYVEKYTIDYSEIGNIFDEIMPEMEKRHEMLMNGDMGELSKCAQILILINNRDALEYISSTKEILELYSRMVKQFKSLGIAFVFSDVEDATVSYSGPELLKKFKESKKAIVVSSLQEFKFCDLPSNAVRSNKTVNPGDVFLMDGSEITRIKLAEEV